MVHGGISIRTIKLIIAVLGLSLLLIASASAVDHHSQPQFGKSHYDGPFGHGHDDGNMHHIDHDWNNNHYDWLSPGGYYWYPTTYHYSWYTVPYYSYTYYPTYYYTEPVYTPVVYQDIDPWWDVYGTTYYYSYIGGSSWTYKSGFGLI